MKALALLSSLIPVQKTWRSGQREKLHMNTPASFIYMVSWRGASSRQLRGMLATAAPILNGYLEAPVHIGTDGDYVRKCAASVKRRNWPCSLYCHFHGTIPELVVEKLTLRRAGSPCALQQQDFSSARSKAALKLMSLHDWQPMRACGGVISQNGIFGRQSAGRSSDRRAKPVSRKFGLCRVKISADQRLETSALTNLGWGSIAE